jgi:hypothetical protein
MGIELAIEPLVNSNLGMKQYICLLLSRLITHGQAMALCSSL